MDNCFKNESLKYAIHNFQQCISVLKQLSIMIQNRFFSFITCFGSVWCVSTYLYSVLSSTLWCSSLVTILPFDSITTEERFLSLSTWFFTLIKIVHGYFNDIIHMLIVAFAHFSFDIFVKALWIYCWCTKWRSTQFIISHLIWIFFQWCFDCFCLSMGRERWDNVNNLERCWDSRWKMSKVNSVHAFSIRNKLRKCSRTKRSSRWSYNFDREKTSF